MSEPNIIKSDDIREVARGQAVVEARHDPGFDCRVISASATVYARTTEVFSGEARYSGKVRFDCLVVHDGKVECISSVAEFSDKITSPDITAAMTPIIVPEVVNTEAVRADGIIKTVAVVDAKLYSSARCEAECASQPEDGIYSETKTVEYSTVVCESTDTAYISDSMSDVKATEIVATTSRAVVTGEECGADEIKVSGAVYSDILVRTEGGLVYSYRMVTPFAKTVSAPGVTNECVAFCECAVADSSASYSPDDGDNRLDLAITLQMDVKAVKRESVETVVDVFCVENELETAECEANVCLLEPLCTAIDTIDGQIKLDKDKDPADNVLCVTGAFCRISEARVENGRVYAEGLVGGDIIYYNAEKNSVDNVAFRIPFGMPLSVTTDSEMIDVSAAVTDVSVRVRRESVFDIKAEVAFRVRARRCEKVRLIKSVKRGESIVRPDATVIVHIAKPDETLWQAAKALGCSPDRVTEQNDATAPFKGGERLVNFCGK